MLTDKERAVLKKMKRWDEQKAVRLFQSPNATDRVLEEFNQSVLDDVGPVGGEQGMKVLQEMNELGALQDEAW